MRARFSGCSVFEMSAVALLITSALLAVATEAPSGGGTYVIAGTLVNSRTGSAVAQARVALLDTNTRKNVATLTTAADGHYSFSGLPAGKYSLVASKPGYLDGAYDQHQGYSSAIVTGRNFETASLVFRFIPTASITGLIRDASGDPVRDAVVTLFVETVWNRTRRVFRVEKSATDDRGYYEFSQLRPGTYYLSVTAKPWYSVSLPSTSRGAEPDLFRNARPVEMVYPTSYYAGTSDAEFATPIHLKGGDHIPIDIALTPAPALHVRFRVNEDAGSPGSVSLSKRVFDSLEHSEDSQLTAMEPGLYEANGVAPGRYRVWLTDAGKENAKKAIEVELNTEGQEIDLSRAESLHSLKFTVMLDGKGDMPARLQLGLMNNRAIKHIDALDASGRVTFNEVRPGRYVILCNDPDGFYSVAPFAVTKTSSNEGQSIGHDITVGSGESDERTVWLTQGKAKIQGIVRKEGKPSAGMMVILIPKDADSQIELFRRDQTDFDGTFNLNGVIPGSYTVIALEGAWEADWEDAEALARFAPKGQHIYFDNGFVGSITLPEPLEVQHW